MNKETYIPQELFEHYEIYMFDINRTKDVYNLILKMWNENKELQQKVNQLESTLDAVEALLKKHIQDINQKIDFEIDMGSQGDYYKIKNFETTVKILKEILNEVGNSNE